MADFDAAFDKMLAHEGGYVNDSTDFGGETYKGISRRFHPRSGAWSIVDAVRKSVYGELMPSTRGQFERMDEALDEHAEQLDVHVRGFYYDYFWSPFWGDKIEAQAVAEELFDTGVNMGVTRAVSFMQEACNLLNRNGSLFKDITVDGKYGPNTNRAVESVLASDKETVLKILNVLQGIHYIELMRKYPAQEKYARGWFRRVMV